MSFNDVPKLPHWLRLSWKMTVCLYGVDITKANARRQDLANKCQFSRSSCFG